MRPIQHEPYIPKHGYFAGSLEQPAEITVYCTCGEWEFSSIESGISGLDTNWMPDFEAHANEESYE